MQKGSGFLRKGFCAAWVHPAALKGISEDPWPCLTPRRQAGRQNSQPHHGIPGRESRLTPAPTTPCFITLDFSAAGSRNARSVITIKPKPVELMQTSSLAALCIIPAPLRCTLLLWRNSIPSTSSGCLFWR